jgi:hypothetical protein
VGVSPDAIREQAQSYLQPIDQYPAAMSPEDAQKAIASAMPGLAAGDDRAAQSRERIVTIMAVQMRVSQDTRRPSASTTRRRS